VQRRLVERRGDDAVHLAGPRAADRVLDGEPAQPTGERGAAGRRPLAHGHVDVDASAGSADDQRVDAGAHGGIGERACDDLGPDAARIAERDRETGADAVWRRPRPRNVSDHARVRV
jgi:hypothetical protein